MALPVNIASKISVPVTSILSYLQSLAQPRGFGLAAPGNVSSTVYGTPVAARKNFKPFIVGLIPPDVPVDFIPFKRVQNRLVDIQPDALPAAAGNSPAPGGQVRATVKVSTGNRGQEQKVSQTALTKDVRKAVYESYFKQTGVYPSDQLVNWMTAQMMVEQGGNVSRISTKNFNFGNTHASGSRAPVGEVPKPPSGGSYYLGVDYDSKNQPYATYFNSFQTLDDGVAYQVNRILVKWPDAANATTIEEYGAGLLPGAPGNYHETRPELYLRGLKLQTDRLDASIAKNGAAGGVIGGPPQQDSPSLSVDNVETNPQEALSIMSVGSVTQRESDPAGDRIGKLTEFDPARAEVARRQTDELRRQIAQIAATPGLLLMVNPSEFTRNFEASVDNSVKGRTGNIVHVWLEKPTTLSCSGVTAGQYVVDPEGNGGLTGQLRVYSASYQNLLSLLSVYKTNGVIYSGSDSQSGVAQLGYSVFIYFDNFIYVGTFDSFEIQDSDQKPHNMAYSFKFNVRYYFEVGNDGRFTDFEIGVNTGYFPKGAAR